MKVAFYKENTLINCEHVFRLIGGRGEEMEDYIFNIISIFNERKEDGRIKFRIIFKQNYWADITLKNDEILVTPGSDYDSEDIEEMIYYLNENVSILAKEIVEKELHIMARLLT